MKFLKFLAWAAGIIFMIALVSGSAGAWMLLWATSSVVGILFLLAGAYAFIKIAEGYNGKL